MGEQNVIDLSSFMLVEAMGDSEMDFDSKIEIMESETDDAESCCGSEGFEFGEVCDLENNYYHEDHKVFSQNWDFAKEDYNDDDEDEDEVISNFGNKSRNCYKSRVEFMDEMEKSRLFWEACLAS